jgi:broad specificity phosphatase PhoE
MATVIYIRHGCKLYDNGKPIDNLPAHDPPLIAGEEKKIAATSLLLRQKYGNPDKIITSPFKRTRQTAGYLICESDKIEITVDSNICEYLGNQKPKNNNFKPQVTDTTNQYKVAPLGESVDNMKQRCRSHLAEIGFCDNTVSSGVTWVVSHGFIIETIVNHLKRWNAQVNIPSNLDMNELDAIVVEYNSTTPIVKYVRSTK